MIINIGEFSTTAGRIVFGLLAVGFIYLSYMHKKSFNDLFDHYLELLPEDQNVFLSKVSKKTRDKILKKLKKLG